MNWLGAKKVQVHGMKSKRWTTDIKMTQYKGLVNLYLRDSKVAAVDQKIKHKVMKKTVTKLREDVHISRDKLTNEIEGDRQAFRYALSGVKELQLKYQNQPIHKAIEGITQQNFDARKLGDRLNYIEKLKHEELVNLKLSFAEVTDKVKEEQKSNKIEVEVQAELVTGKVQEATLKKDSALSVRYIYRKILGIMKKDAIYFDVLLNTLTTDAANQGKCMKNATEMGQLATEYLDDRKIEYQELLRAVKRDQNARQISLKLAREEARKMRIETGAMTRGEPEEANLGKIILPRSLSLQETELEKNNLEKILLFLKTCMFTKSFENIIEVLTAQEEHHNTLEDLLSKTIARRDSMLKRTNHANTIEIVLRDTMLETTIQFTEDRDRLKKQIEEERKRKNDLYSMLLHEKKRLADLRANLQHLLCLTDGISQKGVRKVVVEGDGGRKASKQVLKPTPMIQDGNEIINKLEPRLQILIDNTVEIDDQDTAKALKFYEVIKKTQYGGLLLQFEPELVEEEQELGFKEKGVPTYQDMKAKSKEIVALNSIDPDTIPAFGKKMHRKR